MVNPTNVEPMLMEPGMTLVKLDPPNKTHLRVSIESEKPFEGMSLTFHVESWSAVMHLEALRKIELLVNELQETARSIPTSSCS